MNLHNTSRAGSRWTDEENNKLMKSVLNGEKIEDIACKHQRTINAIKSRIILNALEIMKKDNLKLEDVSKLVNISVEDINYYNNREKNRREIKNNLSNTKTNNINLQFNFHKDFLDILVDIKKILEKINLKIKNIT